MAPFWEKKKEDRDASHFATAKRPTHAEAAPRFTSVQIGRMRDIVRELDLDINLYQHAEVIEDHVRTVWVIANMEVSERQLEYHAASLVATFGAMVRGIDTQVELMRDKQPGLHSSCGGQVKLALEEFQRARHEAALGQDKLREANEALKRCSGGDEEKAHDCLELLQSLRGAITEMHERAPGLRRPLHIDIGNRVKELEELLSA